MLYTFIVGNIDVLNFRCYFWKDKVEFLDSLVKYSKMIHERSMYVTTRCRANIVERPSNFKILTDTTHKNMVSLIVCDVSPKRGRV